ncbi:hypothetical protein LTR27_008837 [Elasticomyces elasticus]|nr:hypothetical protein LTR27_008837 [Elasticomyces elasticus]
MVSSSATITSSSTPTATSGRAHDEQKDAGLSTGAKAGIGAACGAVGLAALVGALFWFVWRRRHASRGHDAARWQQEKDMQEQQVLRTHSSDYAQAAPHYGEAALYGVPKQAFPQEMPGGSPVEMPSDSNPGELLGDVPPGVKK